MRIEMMETKDGANDGFTIKTYQAGHVYEVSEDLGKSFVSGKYAKETDKAVTGEQPAVAAAEEVAQPAPASKPKKSK